MQQRCLGDTANNLSLMATNKDNHAICIHTIFTKVCSNRAQIALCTN